MTRASLWSRRLVITVIVLGLWEALYRVGLLSPLIFGSPSLVYSGGAEGRRHRFWRPCGCASLMLADM